MAYTDIYFQKKKKNMMIILVALFPLIELKKTVNLVTIYCLIITDQTLKAYFNSMRPSDVYMHQ